MWNAISMKYETDPRLIISRYNNSEIFPKNSLFTKILLEAQASTESKLIKKRKSTEHEVLLEYAAKAKRDCWQKVRF